MYVLFSIIKNIIRHICTCYKQLTVMSGINRLGVNLQHVDVKLA